jgi:hypothetical protein
MCPRLSVKVLIPSLHTAGVTCSIHVSPTKLIKGIRHLAKTLGAFFLSYGKGTEN